MKALSVALIGYGNWGRLLEKELTLCEHFDLTAIWNRSELDHPKFNGNLTAVIDSVEAVVIATATDSQHYFTDLCLDHGKHVFCEKPFGNDYVESARLFQKAQDNGCHIFIDFTFYYSRSFAFLQNRINTIGEIKYIQADFIQPGKVYESESVLETIGCHFLFLLIDFIEQDHIKVDEFYHSPVGQTLAAEYHHGSKNKLSLSLNFSLVSPVKERRIRVVGELGELVFAPLSEHETASAFYYEDHRIEGCVFNENNNLQFSFEAFAQTLSGQRDSEVVRYLSTLKLLASFREPAIN